MIDNLSPFEKKIGFDTLFLGAYDMWQRVMNMDLEESKKIKIANSLNRAIPMMLKDKTPNSQRYFKRSFNQLIKALRRL